MLGSDLGILIRDSIELCLEIAELLLKLDLSILSSLERHQFLIQLLGTVQLRSGSLVIFFISQTFKLLCLCMAMGVVVLVCLIAHTPCMLSVIDW